MTAEAVWENVVAARAHRAFLHLSLLRRTLVASVEHDVLTVAQAVAYSAMLALFPALIVTAAAVALLPETLPLRLQLGMFFARILPPNVSPLLAAYFGTTHNSSHTAGALLGSLLVGVTGASNVMATLMEGFRRAHGLPVAPGDFWRRRRRALVLMPLSLVPMALASGLVVFGHLLTTRLAGLAREISPALEAPVYAVAVALRWGVAVAGSVGILAMIYHLGTDLDRRMRAQIEPFLREPWVVLRRDWSWRSSVPGAAVATALWFVATLLFGLYVTRFANYGQVYGSLGAAIALMVWLYLIALSVLAGAEFNAQRLEAPRLGHAAGTTLADRRPESGVSASA